MLNLEKKQHLNYLFEDFFRMIGSLFYHSFRFVVGFFTNALKMLFPNQSSNN